MTHARIRTAAVCLAFLAFVPVLKAGDWELGGSIVFAKESERPTSSNGNYPTIPYTAVVNSMKGAWNEGALEVGYEALRLGQWSLWVNGQYLESLAKPGIYHSGEDYQTGSTTVESFNGSATHKAHGFGLRLDRHFGFGELGVGVLTRSHDLSVSGRRQTQHSGVFTYDQATFSHAFSDILVSAAFTLTQKQARVTSFQRISFGFGLGGSLPGIQPGASDFLMSDAYLAQFRPGNDVRVTLGVRF